MRSLPIESRTQANAAFATLVAVMTGHSLLTTARDALFLASIPATQLPFVYLGVAVLALASVLLQRAAGTSGLMVPLALSGGVTIALWALLPVLGEPGLYALYVWSGLLGTSIVVQFWLRVGRLFALAEAKQMFAFIGGGAVVGALLGTALAAAISSLADARTMLLASGVVFWIGLVPARWIHAERAKVSSRRTIDADISAAQAFGRPYVRHVTAIVVVSSMTLTVLDWLFKDAIVQLVPPEQLGLAFAVFYLCVNALSLGVQLLAVGPAMRTLGITTALGVLPFALLGGGVWALLGGGAIAAIAVKTGEGSLRYTLQKTGMELLYVPMPDRVRDSVKEVIDIAGSRGGQAAASLGILGLLAVGLTPWWALVGLALTWLTLVMLLRGPYLEVFRRTLRELVVDVRPDLQALDVESLDALIAAFSSPNDHEVLASLSVLEHQGRAHLVPTLLLYHPADDVVETALDMFARARRTDFVPVAERLLGNATPRVHAAIVRALHQVRPDDQFLRDQLDSFCIATRATTALYGLEAGVIDAPEAGRRIDEFMASSNANGRLALAKAAPASHADMLSALLDRLIDDDDPRVRHSALLAIRARGGIDQVPHLLAALSDLDLRPLASRALVELGTDALPEVDRALGGAEAYDEVRWLLPRIVSELPPSVSVPVLVQHLEGQEDGLVEYRLIRALERVARDHPDVRLPRTHVDEILRRTVLDVLALCDARLALSDDDSEDTEMTREMLLTLLEGKIRHARERIVRLALLDRVEEDTSRIVRGLRSKNPVVRSSSIELIESLRGLPQRPTIVALVLGASWRQIVDSAPDLYSPRRHTADGALHDLLDHSSEPVRLLARRRLDELAPDPAEAIR